MTEINIGMPVHFSQVWITEQGKNVRKIIDFPFSFNLASNHTVSLEFMMLSNAMSFQIADNSELGNATVTNFRDRKETIVTQDRPFPYSPLGMNVCYRGSEVD